MLANDETSDAFEEEHALYSGQLGHEDKGMTGIR